MIVKFGKKTWVPLSVLVGVVLIVFGWQWHWWRERFIRLYTVVSSSDKSVYDKIKVAKFSRYDNLQFESELTPEEHQKIEDLTRSFKQILIYFAVKSLYAPDIENIAQEMFAAEKDPRGRDKYSRYQSRKGLKEEREADSSWVKAPTWKINTVDSIATVKIWSFAPELPDKLAESLDIITQFGIDKFVIDLRDNQGGDEESALLPLGFFMRQGDVAYVRKERDEEKIYNQKFLVKDLKALNVGRYQHLRNIVLVVNRKTASAAEIFAAVMQNWGYLVIGEKTFGKGVGQVEYSLPAPAGSVFIITAFECLVGKGRKKLDGIGVTPNIVIRNSKSEKTDFQMEAAIKILQNKISGD